VLTIRVAHVSFLLIAFASRAVAQSAAVPASAAAQPAPPPATKLEAFKPAAGSVVTFGYNELGKVGGASVDVRQMRAGAGTAVRGLVVQVTQGQYREERAFVDADEISELLRGIDALLEVTKNPTTFENFEVRYTTRGELRITAFSSRGGGISYSIEAGRITRASTFVDAKGIAQLRAIIVAAQDKLK
jgi:hypothetical protein